MREQSASNKLFKCSFWNVLSNGVVMNKHILAKRRPMDAWIRQIFACGIRNLGNLRWWIPKYWALKSGIYVKKYEIQVQLRHGIPSATTRISLHRA